MLQRGLCGVVYSYEDDRHQMGHHGEKLELTFIQKGKYIHENHKDQ
jgi:hypothetical protein